MDDLSLPNGEFLRPGKVVCVGRNYLAHAHEMGSNVPSEPIFFLKPSTSLVPGGGKISLPRNIGRIDHEVELAVIIADTVKDISSENALKHVLGYGVLLDITARDVQKKAKELGLPWSVAKGYDGFAPISDVVSSKDVCDPHALDIFLDVNGERRQEGSTGDMVFSVEQLISHISKVMTLERGDIIATGTPEGVGPVHPGDIVNASITKIGKLSVEFL